MIEPTEETYTALMDAVYEAISRAPGDIHLAVERLNNGQVLPPSTAAVVSDYLSESLETPDDGRHTPTHVAREVNALRETITDMIRRRSVAAELDAIASNYPADVFPADSTTRDGIAGTAIREVLTRRAAALRGDGDE